MIAKKLGERQKLLRVTGKSRELGKDNAGDVAAFDVLHHAPGFGMFLDGFAGDTGKVIHFSDRPAACGGIGSGAFKVVGGAFAFGLIFARNANPDADVFQRIILDAIFPHILLHTRHEMPVQVLNAVSEKKKMSALI